MSTESLSQEWGRFIDSPEASGSPDEEWGIFFDEPPRGVTDDEQRALELKRQMSLLTPDQVHALNSNIEAELVDPLYPFPKELMDGKAEAEKRSGRDFTWPEWILTISDVDTANELFAWVDYRDAHINNDTRTQECLRMMRTRFEQGLVTSVDQGEVSPLLLNRYRQQSETPVHIGGFFSSVQYQGLGRNRYLDNNTNRVDLARGGKVPTGTYVHEQLHSLGGFADDASEGDGIWVEGSTSILTRIIAKNMPEYASADHLSHNDDERNAYLDEQEAVRAALILGRISTKDLSHEFAKADPENLPSLLGIVGGHAGIDLRTLYRERVRHYQRRASEGNFQITQGDVAHAFAQRLTKVAQSNYS